MDLQDLVGPIAAICDDASEEDAPPCERCRTRRDEEFGEDRSLSDDEPDGGITDARLARDAERGAPKSDDDEPWDGIIDAMLAQE